MGTDARLFSTKTKQSFYYDREYNLPVNDLRYEGLTKKELLLVVETILNIGDDNERINVNVLYRVQEWVESLPDDDIIYSRNEHENEYFRIKKTLPK